MVAPGAADQQMLASDADLGERVAAQDPLGCGVVEQRPSLEPVQRELAERELDRLGQGAAGEAAAVPALVDPVADRGRLQRAADDLRERDRSGDRTVVVDDREPQPIPARKPLGLAVGREERLRPRRLVRLQERAVGDAQPASSSTSPGSKRRIAIPSAGAARRRRP